MGWLFIPIMNWGFHLKKNKSVRNQQEIADYINKTEKNVYKLSQQTPCNLKTKIKSINMQLLNKGTQETDQKTQTI